VILRRRCARAAQTGSGKTAAFALPLLQSLLDNRSGPRQLHGLVLVPTRELAVQVGESMRKLVAHLPMQIKVAIVFGGVSINPQMMALRGGADIVVATPGRLLDLIDHNALKIGRTAMFVLDEADRLLDLGFSEAEPHPVAVAAAAAEPVLLGHFPAAGAGAGRTHAASAAAWKCCPNRSASPISCSAPSWSMCRAVPCCLNI
jgi:hypothetical protein